MAITEQQRVNRRGFLGSSDIAALFTDDDGKSLNPFKTARDVWASKVYELEPVTSKAMDRGNRYEHVLLEYAEQELGVQIETAPEKMWHESGIFACNLDGFTLSEPRSIVEAKTTGMAQEWGEPWSDQVPFRVNLQVQQQMMCTGIAKTYIVVLMGRYGLTEEIYEVEANEPIQQAIRVRGEQFWNDYVLTKTPPPEAEPGNITVFKRIQREPEKEVEIPKEKIDAWLEAKEAARLIKKQVDSALADVLAHLGDAEAAPYDGEKRFTYMMRKGADKLNRTRLRESYPDIYAEVAEPNSYRVATLKKI